MVTKVHHWKHGWIPIDAVAQAIKSKKGGELHVVNGQAGEGNYRVEKFDDAPNVAILNPSSAPPGLGVFARNDYYAIQWGTSDHSADEMKREVATTIQGVFDRLPGLKRQDLEVSTVNSEGEYFAATSSGGHHEVSIDRGLYEDQFAEAKRKQFAQVHFQLGANEGDLSDYRKATIIHEIGHVIKDRVREEKDPIPKGRAGVEEMGRRRRAGEPAFQDPISLFVEEPTTPAKEGWESSVNGEWLNTEQPRWKVDTLRKQSAYAGAGTEEFYAEAFLDGYLHGDKATPSGRRAYQLAVEAFGKP